MTRSYRAPSELPATLPVFPLAGCLLLPRSELPLNIFEPRYLAMVDAALRGDRMIGMIQPADQARPPATPELYAVGCAGRLTRFAETGDGRYLVSLEGVCRFRTVRETTSNAPFRSFDVDFSAFEADLGEPSAVGAADRAAVLDALRAFVDRHAIKVDWESINGASDEALINSLSMMSPFGAREKQALLESPTLQARGAALVAITKMELAAAPGGRAQLQ